jgi:HTH-type transcriptional regulator/antitoxin HigA
MTAVIDEKKYANLLAGSLPHVIYTEAENESYIAALEALYDRGPLTAEEQRLAELLTLLIETFERKTYQLEPSNPVDVVRHLMDASGLKQKDLREVFGSESLVSEFLNGKRGLSKTQISRLSERFAVSPELFFERFKTTA